MFKDVSSLSTPDSKIVDGSVEFDNGVLYKVPKEGEPGYSKQLLTLFNKAEAKNNSKPPATGETGETGRSDEPSPKKPRKGAYATDLFSLPRCVQGKLY